MSHNIVIPAQDGKVLKATKPKIARDQFAKIRICALGRWPYCSTALAAMEPYEVEGLGTMAVDRYWRVYYDPQLITRDWTILQSATVLLHELSHCIRNHAKRCEVNHYNPAGWNIAADCEINDDLEKDKTLDLPNKDQICLPSAFGLPDNKLAEWYYEQLAQQAEKNGSGQPGENGQQSGNGQRGGSCADGQQREWEFGAPSGSQESDGEKSQESGNNPHGIAEHTADIIRDEVARQIQQSAKHQGNIPGGWKRWAEDRITPKVNWRRELPSLVRRTIEQIRGNQDYAYRRPSRRGSACPNVILPSTVSPTILATVVIDTSGSMSNTQLGEAVSEVGGILKAVAGSRGVRVLCCDTQVSFAKTIFNPKDIRLSGGGGTDMSNAILVAAKELPASNVIIVLTDGYTDWPSKDVGIPVIAGIVGGGKDSTPDWIKSVIIE